MAIPFRYVPLLFRIASVGLIATGLVRLVGLVDSTPSWSAFVFYTTQSNVLCLLWMAALAIGTTRDIVVHGARGPSAPAPRLGGAVMMAITVTMLVYLVLLAPGAFQQEGGDFVPFSLTDNLVHVVTPCLVIADWLLFSPKGRLRWFDPLLWTLLPYAYLAFAFIRAALGGDFGAGRAFPYPFMDVGVHGVGGVALWILGLTVTLVLVGYVYVAVDALLARMAGSVPPAGVEPALGRV